MGADLVGEAVLLLRQVAGLLQQGEVDVALDVALGAGIAVPVPGAAEVRAALDDAEAVDAGVAQLYAGINASAIG